MKAEHGREDRGRQILGKLDQRSGAGWPDGNAVGCQMPGKDGSGDVLAGPVTREESHRRG